MADQALGPVNQQKTGEALAILPHQGGSTFRFCIIRIIAKIGRRHPRLGSCLTGGKDRFKLADLLQLQIVSGVSAPAMRG